MSRHALLLLLLCCATARGQGSDLCASATPISGTGSFAFDTSAATTDGAAIAGCTSSGQIHGDLWWSWFCTTTEPYSIETCSTAGFDTALAVYDGSCSGPLEACGDEGCGNGGARVVVDAFAGHTYLIRVGRPTAGAGGAGSLTIGLHPLPAIERSFTDPTSGHLYHQLAGSSWRDAERKAQQLGAHLATLGDQAEHDWLVAQFHLDQGQPIDLWIGLNDRDNEGMFTWSSAQSVSFTNWSPGQPDDGQGAGEDFVALRKDEALARWIDLADLPAAPHALPHGLVEFVSGAAQAFCFGDGLDPSHTTLCPCGNHGGTGRGCANSFVPQGARLAGGGAANPDTLTLYASGLPAGVTVVFVQQDAPGDSVLFDGVSCASGSWVRLATRGNVAGLAALPLAGDPALSVLGGVVPGSGARRYYSAHYRNAAPFCTPATANTTNALRVDW